MSEVADLVADLKRGMPVAFEATTIEPKSAARSKKPKKTEVATLFERPQKKRRPRLRCSFDLELELAERFKGICSNKGFQQREIIEGFVRAFVEHHSR